MEPSCEAAVAFASGVVEVAAESFAVVAVLPPATLVTVPARPELRLALGELSVSYSCDR